MAASPALTPHVALDLTPHVALDLAPRVAFDLAIDYARRILRPGGEIDVATAPILLDAANALIATAVGDLTIDFAEVTFADSGLLHALLDIRALVRAQGAGLWLVNEPSCVLRLFMASGFRAVLAR
jgi:anti-sigma B factor antagonist